MNAEQFAYWLNGFVEMNPNAMVTGTQWQIIKDHLALVHQKVTPTRFPGSFQTDPISPTEHRPRNWHLTEPTLLTAVC